MVEVWFRMLEEHVPDTELRCRSCTNGGTGARHTPWPCALRTVAETARERFAASSGPVTVPMPRGPVDGPPPRKRRLRGLHGPTRVLTSREQQYLQLAADGCPDEEIARQLGLPHVLVGTTLRRLGRSLGVADRGSLLVLAIREGVIG
ncbi:response regulator transcription factor [Pseudonocardia sp. GCM10023141]|uniref:response regulator transcription factor n=1 Tax=Pseudonocardia sp. GCM10023141 TaxID=3252653 RepID=UPI00361EC70E